MKRQEETPSKGREEHVDWQVQSSRQDRKWRSKIRGGTAILGKPHAVKTAWPQEVSVLGLWDVCSGEEKLKR